MAFRLFSRRIGLGENRMPANSEEILMPVFVRAPGPNKKVTLMMKPSDKIVSIKARIEEIVGYPCPRQRLLFSDKGLDDDSTLADNHIRKNSTLDLILLSSVIFCDVHILPSNRFISLRVPQGLTATIREVKDLLREEEATECEDLYLDDEVIELRDDVTLEACNVPDQRLVWVQSSSSNSVPSSPSKRTMVRWARSSSENRRGRQRNRPWFGAVFDDVFILRRTVPGPAELQSNEMASPPRRQPLAGPEDKADVAIDPNAALDQEFTDIIEASYGQRMPDPQRDCGPIVDVEKAAAVVPNLHHDCERKFSLVLDERDRIQKDLTELQADFPRQLSLVLDEKNKIQQDLIELQSEFPRQLSLVLDEKVKLQQDLTELQVEFPKQLSLALDENSKLRSESIVLQHELHSARLELGHERERTLCTICLDRPRDTLIFSCLHLHFCSPCLQLHQERTSTCPTCRGFISGKLVCNTSLL